MPEPLVSVIIPMYNHARYVRECLDSLLNEGWPNLEVLILDDGSKDNSFDVVQQWRAEHPTAFQHFELNRQENQGVTRTLNKLVEMAKGQYITLVASDDCLLPGGIAARIGALQEHPEWLAVFGDCVVIDGQSKRLSESGLTGLYSRSARPKSLLDRRLIALELILRWSVPGPGLLLRKVAYDLDRGVGKYDEKLIIEDRHMYLRLLAKNALGFIEAKVAVYRWHPSSTVHSNAARKRRQVLDLSSSAARMVGAFRGIERFALKVDAQKMQTAYAPDLPSRGLGLFWRVLWGILLLIQDLRLAWHTRLKGN